MPSASKDVLTREQRAVVEDTSPALRVLAAAGTGKTHTVVHAIHHAIEMGRAVPFRVAALTFTREAAHSLGRRLDALSPGLGRDVASGTLHAFAARRLGFQGRFLSPKRARRIAETLLARFTNGAIADRAFARALASSAEDDEERVRCVLSMVSYCRNFESACSDVLARQYPNLANEGSRVRRLVSEYERMKGDDVDFDDVLLSFRDKLREDAAFRERMRTGLDLLLVDEYQDLNRVQHETILLLTHPRYAGRPPRFVAVGDERQAIYGFRGARYDLLLDLPGDYPEGHVRTLTLTRNFRSTKRILDGANSLFPEHEAPLRPRPKARAGRSVEVQGFERLGDEAAWILKRIDRLRRRGVPPGRMAILTRSRWQLAAIESLLRERAIEKPEGDPVANVWRNTIHAAKGLEWDHVFLIGAHEGGIPTDRALASEAAGFADAVAGERRLFYVAVTRARETCTVTHVRATRGESRFIPALKGVQASTPSPRSPSTAQPEGAVISSARTYTTVPSARR